jgi:Zn-dependent peptidase ImmA (M78 family)
MKHKKKKSSVQKGNEFEDKVFLAFSLLLSNRELHVSKEGSTIYQKKGYYSRDRQKNIIVDISIETSMKNAADYSLLTVIECKDYGRLVQVEDIEEFKAKLDQIGGKNVKGIMVSRRGFGEVVLNYAKAQGIALARLLDSDKVAWDIYRATYTKIKTKENIDIFNNEMYRGLTNTSNSNYCFCKYRDNYYNSLSNLLFELEIDNNGDNAFIEYFVKKNFADIPYIKRERIEIKANEVLAATNKADTLETSLDMVIDYIKRKYSVKFNEVSDLGINRNGNRILAQFNPRKMIIEIHSDLDEHRKRFTIAHEIGHVILHSQYLISPVSEIDSSINNFSSYILDKDNTKRMEIQANIFAAYLLMPKKVFRTKTVDIALRLGYKPKGDYLIYIDEQPCNIRNFHILTSYLSSIFNVSRQAVEYHLKSFGGYIKDGRKYNF